MYPYSSRPSRQLELISFTRVSLAFAFLTNPDCLGVPNFSLKQDSKKPMGRICKGLVRIVAYNKSSFFGLMILAELALFIGEVLLLHQKLDAVHELIVLEEDIKEAVHSLDLEDLRLHLSLH